jgi:hypothetical protein
MTRLVRRSVVVAVLAALAVGATSWWFVRDDRPRADVGQVVPAADGTVEGARSTVAIPWARLDVVVAEPSRGLPSTRVAGTDLRAPRGGSFVGISVDLAEDRLIPMPRTATAGPRPAGFTLLADGRRYPVTGLMDGGAPALFGEIAVHLAVEGSPEHLELEVTFDGESQTVDPRGDADRPGRFAELAGVPRDFPAKSCGQAMWPRRFGVANAAPTCTIRWAARVPYVAGLGWAAPGRAWLAVTAETTPPQRVRWSPETGAPATEYGVDVIGPAPATFQLGGQRPAAVIQLNDVLLFKDPGRPQQAIFTVAAGPSPAPVTVTRQVHTFPAGDPVAGAPRNPVVPVTWRVAVP